MENSSNYRPGTREHIIAHLRESGAPFLAQETLQDDYKRVNKIIKNTGYEQNDPTHPTSIENYDDFIKNFIKPDENHYLHTVFLGSELSNTLRNTAEALDPANIAKGDHDAPAFNDRGNGTQMAAYVCGGSVKDVSQPPETFEKCLFLKDLREREQRPKPPQNYQKIVNNYINANYWFCNPNVGPVKQRRELTIPNPRPKLELSMVPLDTTSPENEKKISDIDKSMLESKGFYHTGGPEIEDGRIILFCQNPQYEKPFFNANRRFVDQAGQPSSMLKFIARHLDVDSDQEMVQYIGSYGFCHKPWNFDDIKVELYHYQSLLTKEFNRIDGDASLNATEKTNQKNQVIKMTRDLFFVSHNKSKDIEIDNNGKIIKLIHDLANPAAPGATENITTLGVPAPDAAKTEDQDFLKVDRYDLASLTYKKGFRQLDPNYKVLDIDSTFDPRAPASEQSVQQRIIRVDDRFTTHPEFDLIQDQQAINNMLDIRGLKNYSVKSLQKIANLQIGYLLNNVIGQTKRPAGQDDNFYKNTPKDIPYNKHFNDDIHENLYTTGRIEMVPGIFELGYHSSIIENLKRLVVSFRNNGRITDVDRIFKAWFIFLEGTKDPPALMGNALFCPEVRLEEEREVDPKTGEYKPAKRYIRSNKGILIDDYGFIKEVITRIEDLPETTLQQKQIKVDIKRHLTSCVTAANRQIHFPILSLLMKYGYITPEKLSEMTAEIINKENTGSGYPYWIAVDPEDREIYTTLKVNNTGPARIPGTNDFCTPTDENPNGPDECKNYFFQQVLRYLGLPSDNRTADVALKKNQDFLVSYLQGKGYKIENPPGLEKIETEQAKMEEERKREEDSKIIKAMMDSNYQNVPGEIKRKYEAKQKRDEESDNKDPGTIPDPGNIEREKTMKNIVLLQTLSEGIEKISENGLHITDKQDIGAAVAMFDTTGRLNNLPTINGQNLNNNWANSKIIQLTKRVHSELDAIGNSVKDLILKQNENQDLKGLGKQVLDSIEAVRDNIRVPIYEDATTENRTWIVKQLNALKDSFSNVRRYYDDFITLFNNYNKLQAKANNQVNLEETKKDWIKQIETKAIELNKENEAIYKKYKLYKDKEAKEAFENWVKNNSQTKDNLIGAISSFRGENIDALNEGVQSNYNDFYKKNKTLGSVLKKLSEENKSNQENIQKQTTKQASISHADGINNSERRKINKRYQTEEEKMEETMKKRSQTSLKKMFPKSKRGFVYDGKQFCILVGGTIGSAGLAIFILVFSLNPLYLIAPGAVFLATFTAASIRKYRHNKSVDVANAKQEAAILAATFVPIYGTKTKEKPSEQQTINKSGPVSTVSNDKRPINNNNNNLTGITNGTSRAMS